MMGGDGKVEGLTLKPLYARLYCERNQERNPLSAQVLNHARRYYFSPPITISFMRSLILAAIHRMKLYSRYKYDDQFS